MCSYCGCEAEPVMQGLMDDHAEIAGVARKIAAAIDEGAVSAVVERTLELSQLFDRHTAREEAGLFHQLQLAGEAVAEVDRLLADHRRLRAGLSDPATASRPEQLRQLLTDLLDHAEIEETDLFPYALQVLPGGSWGLMGSA
ncbi:MAG: hemerythrin domain-containing protein [Acidimicrobiales bacterium]